MQNTSAAYKTAIAATDREIRGYIKFNGTFTLSGADGLISFKTTQNAMDTQRFCVGSTTSAFCEATFFNYGLEGSGVSLANSYFDAYIGVNTVIGDETSTEYVCCGRYYISEISRYKDTTRIVGYDIAGRLSINYVPTVTKDPDHGYLAMDILNDIIDQTGVNGGDPFTTFGDDVYVPEIYAGTCRDQWGWLCTIINSPTVYSYTGNREPQDLGYIAAYGVGATINADNSVIYMDGVTFGEPYEITSFTTGTADNPIVVGNGTGMYGLNPYMTRAVAEDIEDVMDAYSYTPATMRWRGDPALDVMDAIFVSQDGTVRKVVCMKIETTFNGGLEQTITCYGDSEEYYAMSTSPMESRVNAVSNLIGEIQQAIETADNGVCTKILDADGTWKEFVIANNQDLDQATSVWRFNINGLAHSNRYQGGTYTLAMDTQGRIVANVIQTGILQDAAGNNSWNLDTGELHITDGSIVVTFTITYDHNDYSQADLTTIQSFITGNITFTDEQWEKYSINGDGVMRMSDLIKIRNMINYGRDIVKTVTVTINPEGTTRAIRVDTHVVSPTDATTGTSTDDWVTYYDGESTKVPRGMFTTVNASYIGNYETETPTNFYGKFFPNQSINKNSVSAYINDFVVAQGTASGWRYREWNSGVYECWYSVAGSTKAFSAWGTVYCSTTSTAAINYPVTFASRPWEFAEPTGSNSVWLDRSGLNTTTHSATYEGLRPVSGSANFGVDLYVCGIRA